jgi:hypothetical protein
MWMPPAIESYSRAIGTNLKDGAHPADAAAILICRKPEQLFRYGKN